MKGRLKGRSRASEPRLRPRLRVLWDGDVALGPGRIDLLEHIARTGSLRAAAAAMGMSYMRAWTLVKSVNGWFRQPLVIRVRGGKTGGGARLTETGSMVVALYRRMEKESEDAIRKTWKEMRKLF